MPEDNGAAALPDLLKPMPPEDGQDLLRRQSWHPGVHTATRTFVAPTS